MLGIVQPTILQMRKLGQGRCMTYSRSWRKGQRPRLEVWVWWAPREPRGEVTGNGITEGWAEEKTAKPPEKGSCRWKENQEGPGSWKQGEEDTQSNSSQYCHVLQRANEKGWENPTGCGNKKTLVTLGKAFHWVVGTESDRSAETSFFFSPHPGPPYQQLLPSFFPVSSLCVLILGVERNNSLKERCSDFSICSFALVPPHYSTIGGLVFISHDGLCAPLREKAYL